MTPGSGDFRPTTVDLAGVDLSGADGAVWSLPHEGDLDANVVKLGPGGRIPDHRNDEVDVLIVVLGGSGDLVVDEETEPLRPHSLARIPKGTRRGLQAGAEGLVYLTVHRARAGLRLTRRPNL